MISFCWDEAPGSHCAGDALNLFHTATAILGIDPCEAAIR